MSPDDPQLLLLASLATLPATAFLLRQACSLWQAELPSYPRAFFSVFFVGLAACFLIDGGGYLLMRMTAEGGITLAEDYSYSDWLWEPFALKWQAMGIIPGLRYLVIATALCLVGILQTFVLGGETGFRTSTAIFLTGWLLNVTALLLTWCGLAFLLASPQEPGLQPPVAAKVQSPEPRLRIHSQPLADAPLPREGAREEDGKGAPQDRQSSPVVQSQLSELQRKLNQLAERMDNKADPVAQERAENLRQQVNRLLPTGGPLAQQGRPAGPGLTSVDVSNLHDNLSRIAAFYREADKGPRSHRTPVNQTEIEEICQQLSRVAAELPAASTVTPHGSGPASFSPGETAGEASPDHERGRGILPRVGRYEDGADAEGTHSEGEEEGGGTNRYLGSLIRSSEPVTRRFPSLIRRALDGGGWWPLLGLITVGSVFWLESCVRRVRAGLILARRNPLQASKRRMHQEINLKDLSPGPAGPHGVVVKGLPASVRLIVIAPGGSGVGELTSEMAFDVLDGIKHGLGDIAWKDRPEVRLWGAHFTGTGFPKAFAQSCQVPQLSRQRSLWVLVAGSITIARQRFFVGLALRADEPNNIQPITINNEQWLDVLATVEAD